MNSLGTPLNKAAVDLQKSVESKKFEQEKNEQIQMVCNDVHEECSNLSASLQNYNTSSSYAVLSEDLKKLYKNNPYITVSYGS